METVQNCKYGTGTVFESTHKYTQGGGGEGHRHQRKENQ